MSDPLGRDPEDINFELPDDPDFDPDEAIKAYYGGFWGAALVCITWFAIVVVITGALFAVINVTLNIGSVPVPNSADPIWQW